MQICHLLELGMEVEETMVSIHFPLSAEGLLVTPTEGLPVTPQTHPLQNISDAF